MGVVFVKTRKGQEEMEKRTGGLTPRVRRALILVDGKRTVDDLRSLTAADDLTHTLGALEEDGYIEVGGVKGADGIVMPSQPLPAITAFREMAGESDPLSLAKARNFMTNTLNVFVGALGTSSLLDRIEKSRTHTELRAVYDEWYHAIVSSRDGKREAESLRTKLLEVI